MNDYEIALQEAEAGLNFTENNIVSAKSKQISKKGVYKAVYKMFNDCMVNAIKKYNKTNFKT